LAVIGTVKFPAHISVSPAFNILKDSGLLHKRAKHYTKPRSFSGGSVRSETGFLMRESRQGIEDIVVSVARESHLFQVIRTLHSSGGFAGSLDSRQE